MFPITVYIDKRKNCPIGATILYSTEWVEPSIRVVEEFGRIRPPECHLCRHVFNVGESVFVFKPDRTLRCSECANRVWHATHSRSLPLSDLFRDKLTLSECEYLSDYEIDLNIVCNTAESNAGCIVENVTDAVPAARVVTSRNQLFITNVGTSGMTTAIEAAVAYAESIQMNTFEDDLREYNKNMHHVAYTLE